MSATTKSAAKTTHRINGHMDIQYSLFLGRSIPQQHGGGTVCHADVNEFIADCVLPVFSCITVSDAQGIWRDYFSNNTIYEDTTVITIIAGTHDTFLIHAIAKEYKRRFSQDAVLVTETATNSQLI